MKNPWLFLFLIPVFCSLNGQNNSFTETELGFNPGEIKIVTSPDPVHIESVPVAEFRGLLRLGQPRVYYSRNLDRMELANTGLKRKDLEFHLRDGLIQYFSLISMEVANNTINLATIREAFRPGTALEDNNAQYARSIDSYWAIVLKEMGAKNLKPESFLKYFCPNEQQCLPLHMPKSSAAYQQKLRRARWGGGQGEFAEMRKFNEFMEEQAGNLINWSKGKTPNEVYMVGRSTLGEYNFNAGGFVLKGIKAVSTGPVTIVHNAPEETSLFRPNYAPEGQSYQTGMLVKMSPEEAETLINRLQKSGRTRQLYYVYRAKIKAELSENELANTNYHLMIKYTQEPSGRTIEFFSDDALTDKLFEISN